MKILGYIQLIELKVLPEIQFSRYFKQKYSEFELTDKQAFILSSYCVPNDVLGARNPKTK